MSALFAWGAATALATAMVAFAADLARRADDRTGPPAATSPGTVTRPRRAAGAGMATTWLATVMLVAAIVLRGIAAGRTPWSNMYEFTLVGAATALIVFLLLNLRRDLRFLGTFVTGIAALFVVLALNVFYVPATGLFPALQSYWLVIHVGIAVGSAGIFTVSFVLSCLQLLRDSQQHGTRALSGRGWGWLNHLPEPAALEGLSFRLNAIGFIGWTFTLIGGAIWAEDAWGRYWGWDPKEVWTFVIWVIYAAYLHARMTRGWAGRRSAYLVLVGYTCVIFNFTVVNLIINGKHSYSGLTTG
ncbi:c-type cytochrome biogenesis protein CcsB [Isoptericola cucumis]|nr:c-type cytochrome biogenesis protein CcsB [Isoptericola cucumis]